MYMFGFSLLLLVISFIKHIIFGKIWCIEMLFTKKKIFKKIVPNFNVMK